MKGALALALVAVWSFSSAVAVPTPKPQKNTEPQYRLVDLGTLQAGTWSIAYAVNDHGEAVGLSTTTDDRAGLYHAFVFTHHTLLDIGDEFDEHLHSAAVAINNAGAVAGFTVPTNRSVPKLGFLYSNGKVLLHGEASGHAIQSIEAINNDGTFIGESDTGAFLYDRHGFHALPSLVSGSELDVFGLNNRGQAVGSSLDSEFQIHAVIVTPSSVLDLGIPPGAVQTIARAINDFGQAVGWTWNDGFLYQSGAMTLLTNTDGSSLTTPQAINNFGQIVGTGISATGEATALVSINGKLFDLNETTANVGETRIIYANDINRRGVIAGAAQVGGEQHAILLFPGNAAARPDRSDLLRLKRAYRLRN